MDKLKDVLLGLKDKLLGLKDTLMEDKKKLLMAVVIVVFCVLFFRACNASLAERKQSQQSVDNISTGEDYGTYTDDGYYQESAGYDDEVDNEYAGLYNQELLDMQPRLIQRYGALPDGYIWSEGGEVLSLGNTDLSAEESMYAFLNGIRTLDFSSAQLYSRNSSVVSRYNSFYESSEARYASYSDNFYRNMYTLVLMSLQTHKVINTATFAENKQVFTVEIEMLDLSDKDFWLEDKNDIFETLYLYENGEDDSTKSEQYVYEYILKHYEDPNAKRRTVTVNLTLEKDPTLGTGWLVTIDKDIDNYCYYTDGTYINKFIISQYRDEGRDAIREREQAEKETARQKALEEQQKASEEKESADASKGVN